jgi:hypothetical protein
MDFVIMDSKKEYILSGCNMYVFLKEVNLENSLKIYLGYLP